MDDGTADISSAIIVTLLSHWSINMLPPPLPASLPNLCSGCHWLSIVKSLLPPAFYSAALLACRK